MIQSLTLYDLNRAFTQGISMFYGAGCTGEPAGCRPEFCSRKGWWFMKKKVEKGRNKKVYSIAARRTRGGLPFTPGCSLRCQPNKLEVIALSRVYFLRLLLPKSLSSAGRWCLESPSKG